MSTQPAYPCAAILVPSYLLVFAVDNCFDYFHVFVSYK